jgi:hypothetical protein
LTKPPCLVDLDRQIEFSVPFLWDEADAHESLAVVVRGASLPLGPDRLGEISVPFREHARINGNFLGLHWSASDRLDSPEPADKMAEIVPEITTDGSYCKTPSNSAYVIGFCS